MDQIGHELVQNKLESFGVREFPSFMRWMRERWEENPRTLLSMNPPNHAHDVEDGSMDIALREECELKLKHQQSVAGTLFSFKVRKEGRFQKVIRSLSSLPMDEQLEAVMALFVEFRSGDFICNTAEFRYIEENLGASFEGLDNPFYRAVCEAILEGFVESGWMESPLE